MERFENHNAGGKGWSISRGNRGSAGLRKSGRWGVRRGIG